MDKPTTAADIIGATAAPPRPVYHRDGDALPGEDRLGHRLHLLASELAAQCDGIDGLRKSLQALDLLLAGSCGAARQHAASAAKLEGLLDNQRVRIASLQDMVAARDHDIFEHEAALKVERETVRLLAVERDNLKAAREGLLASLTRQDTVTLELRERVQRAGLSTIAAQEEQQAAATRAEAAEAELAAWKARAEAAEAELADVRKRQAAARKAGKSRKRAA